jgi:mannose-6-phosphate isomerase
MQQLEFGSRKPKAKDRKTAPMQTPLRFHPFLRAVVWGGRRLGEVLGKPLPNADAYGESWDVSDHELHRSVVASGPHAGRSLRELMETERAALLGAAADTYRVFPWLIKFLDAADWLSVQVHPDERAVQRLWPGEGSKTEAWFVLEAAPGSRVYAGLLPGTDEARLRAALRTGTVADCLHQFEPRPGDCVFLPAGTVHAVGGGVLLAEVQQTSDATFRLFDWNRRDAQGNTRKLHVEEALASIDWSRGPVEPVRTAGFGASPRAKPGAAGRVRQLLVQCPYFTLEYVRDTVPVAWGGQGRLQVLVVLQGSARLVAEGQEEDISAGQAWVLPAVSPELSCRPNPEFGALLCTLPAGERS